MTTTQIDHVHLERCVALAEEALARGDAPFGSVLVGADGHVLHEDGNRETSAGDPTAHPEFALAQWAAANLDAAARAAATVYTSGEHCPMCAAAHAWVGLGTIVFAASGAQLAGWRESWGAPPSPVRPLAVTDVAPGTPTRGPVAPFDERMRTVHERAVAPR